MKLVDAQTFNNGRITIFKRDNSRKGIWHYRLSIRNKTGYVTRSTKTPDYHEAVKIAQTDYEEFTYRVSNGREIHQDVKFRQLWITFRKTPKVSLSSEHRRRMYEGNGSRYFVPFFGDRRVGAITDTTIGAYWEWRLAYWSNQKSTPATAKITPKPKTLQMEAQMLRQFFNWVFLQGYLARELIVTSPLPKESTQVTRHPAFDKSQWKALRKRLTSWCREPKSATKGPNAVERAHRELFNNYVLFLANSGLRPNEARQLTWDDIKDLTDRDGQKRKIKIAVPGGKTGKRDCIPTKSAKRYLNRVRNQSQHTQKTDFVFCYEDGKPISVPTMSAKFTRLLAETPLQHDRQGRNFTLYSLRHTYATFRLLAKIDPLLLAKNMGTSVKMIEEHYSHVKTEQFADVLSAKEETGSANPLWDDDDY